VTIGTSRIKVGFGKPIPAATPLPSPLPVSVIAPVPLPVSFPPLPSPLPVYPVDNPHQKWARIAVDAAPVDVLARYLTRVIVVRPMLNGFLTLHDAPTLALCTGQNLIYKIDSGLAVQPPAPLGAPVIVTPPVVTGSGQTLTVHTCSTGTWTNSPTTYAYQWKKNQGGNIIVYTGETHSTYTPPNTERGKSIFCTVTASNSLGWGASDSNLFALSSIEFEPDMSPTPMATLPATPDSSAGTLNTTGSVVGVYIPLRVGLTCSALGANGEFIVVYNT
jgi:hypothetical protein